MPRVLQYNEHAEFVMGGGEKKKKTETKYLLTCLPGWHQSVWKDSAERRFSSVLRLSPLEICACPSGRGYDKLDPGLGRIEIACPR